METIQELTKRLEGLVQSINGAEENKEFLTHKYLVISLHIHTELEKIKTRKFTSSQKLGNAKLSTLYRAIEIETKEKPHNLAAIEIYNKIISILELAQNANT